MMQTYRREFRQFLETVPDATIVADREGRIVIANKQTETLFGYGPEELVGQPVEILVPHRFGSIHPRHREDYVHQPRVRPMGAELELYGLRKDGTEFPVEISLSPVESEEGLLVSASIRDVTERRRIERVLREKNVELQKASQAKDRFLASVSHELRTPLNAIIGFTGTLLMKLPGPLTDEQDKQLTIIKSSAYHLLSLINDMLDLAKIEAGKVELHTEPVIVQSIVEEVVASLRSLTESKGLQLEVDVPATPIGLNTDKRALHQILINLANNAIKYTDNGFVRVELIEQRQNGKDMIDLNVIDTGIGFKSEDQPRLFQMFEQLDPSNTRRVDGAGLGLYLCQKLATLLGGSIHFQSTFGEGSTFSLRLPRNA